MTENTPARRLPVRLPPHSDELLSSWIGRHAAFYAVPPLVMLRHCLPEAPSLRAADLHLSSDQEALLANIFGTELPAVHRMTFANVAQTSRRLIATRPTQFCPSCSPGGAEPAPVLRSQLLGWRITCPLCGEQLSDSGPRKLPSPFQPYRAAAARGEKLLDDEAERGISTWTSPTDIARLLLMRRIPRPIPREFDLWRFRVLGAIIPDLDHVVADQEENLPTPAKPILPLHLRPALLAGVAMVEHAGPEMLQMLRGHMMGDNKVRYTDAVEGLIAQVRRPKACSQMQLI
ncbi:MAG: TniQ family protein [Alphaproteobacteria bacterium]|nr:TniQ family protein [Alphaproteobacteria bacterium]MBU1561231.1 TniQ family protein [Alphaproteobacteria bacterium]MBU2302893.1 TniQ family protein [Alphaproteobacteria bacterium]MBU2370327.1 TniQ family protein [Alphaproteobacteria bacterium]